MSQTETAQPLPVPPRPKRRWVRTILLALLFFLTGAVCGGGAMAGFIRNRLHEAIYHPERSRARLEKHLARRLDLDDGQREQVSQILRQRQEALIQIREEAMPKVQAELDRADEQMRQVLRPDQQAKWAEMLARFRGRWVAPVRPAPASQPQ